MVISETAQKNHDELFPGHSRARIQGRTLT